MRGVYIACGMVWVLSHRHTSASYMLNEEYPSNHNTDLQFSHMGKVFQKEADDHPIRPMRTSVIPESEELPESTSTENSVPRDTIQGGSERLMDNVPLLDLKKPESYPSSTTTNKSTANNTTNNTSGPNTTSNNSTSHESKTSNSSVKHGSSTYKGDTSTYVTNNFFNPPIADTVWQDYPSGAKLELEYLWKRINVIDDKLNRLLPIGGGDQKLDPRKRKGLIITFDTQSDPDNPVIDLNSQGSGYDAL